MSSSSSSFVTGDVEHVSEQVFRWTVNGFSTLRTDTRGRVFSPKITVQQSDWYVRVSQNKRTRLIASTALESQAYGAS
jgi:hypothetical protein